MPQPKWNPLDLALMFVLGVVLMLLFTACSNADLDFVADEGLAVTGYHISDANIVLEFQLSDSTRCVVLDTYHGGGIDCDFKEAP